MTRRTLEETWDYLDLEMPRDKEGAPYVPPDMPNSDDEVLGFSFFREGWEDADFSDLTLPRTYFGRSGFERVSFSNTCLTGSRICWNDFIECDFSEADLSGCDMRATVFQNCSFANADLPGEVAPFVRRVRLHRG